MKRTLCLVGVMATATVFAQVSPTAQGFLIRTSVPSGKTLQYELNVADQLAGAPAFPTRSVVQVRAKTASQLEVALGLQKPRLVAASSTQILPWVNGTIPFGAIQFSPKAVRSGGTWTHAATYPGLSSGAKLTWTLVRVASGSAELRCELMGEGTRASVVGRGTLVLDSANGLMRSWKWDEQLTTYASTNTYNGVINRRRVSLVRKS
ncbi:MAG: hypothetical protein JNJ45_08985 [Chthonomonas sp.]|nr:hypothetical protein [Chthonomonas sp.]